MQLLKTYFPDLSSRQFNQYEDFIHLYKEWNQRINLISRKDIDSLEEKHILHSLSIPLFRTFRKHSKILDIGTGGGFPGLPLAIYYPECTFFLIDSIGKKIRVVQDIADQLQLTNVIAKQMRVEAFDQPADYFVSRAVASSKQLLQWTKHLKKQGVSEYIFLKGGDLNQEMKEIGYKAKIIPLYTYIDRPFFESKKIVWIKG